MIRFTQTDKWEDKWFRKLKVGEKLIFLYLCDKCDLAGFMEWDGEFASFQIGVEADKVEGALKGLARGIVMKGDYIWIKNFLKHQKNSPLNPNNPAHKNIIRCISERKEFHKDIEKLYGALKPLFRGIGIGISKGISKGIGKGIGKGSFSKENIPTIEEFKEYCEKDLSEYELDPENIYHGYATANWHDSQGKAIKNWKQKVRQVWCGKKKKKEAPPPPELSEEERQKREDASRAEFDRIREKAKEMGL